jgi:polyhydroxyalkanoate synthesis regulator phasin
MYRSIDSSRVRNLKVVAMLKKGQRLRTKAHHYAIDDYTSILSVQPLYRYMTGENKEETVDSISRLVESCVKQGGLSDRDNRRLVDQLKNVNKGLDNLAVTYKDNSTAVAGIEFIKEMIHDFILIGEPDHVDMCEIDDIGLVVDEVEI